MRELEDAKLVKERRLGRRLTEAEMRHVRSHRPVLARRWRVLSELTVDDVAAGACRPSPPFTDFLQAIDAVAKEPADLHCIGRFAVSAYYGLDRPTGDVDICNAVPHSAAA